MSQNHSNQRQGGNQRRYNNKSYDNNNNRNNNNQQQNNKNQQRRPQYQLKSKSGNQNYSNNNNNRYNRNSPKISPQSRYKNTNRGPSSPNNRPQNRQQRYNQNSHDNDQYYNNPNNNNGGAQGRFALKQKSNNSSSNNQSQRNNSGNNNYNNRYPRRQNSNSSNNQSNNSYNNNSMNDMDLNQNNKQMPPGFRGGNDGNNTPTQQGQNYPPNRYRPNDTNNSERNRNWRNRPNTDNNISSDMSPRFQARNNTNYNNQRGYNQNQDDNNNNNNRYARSQHSHSRSPPQGPYNGPYNNQQNNDNYSNQQRGGGQSGSGQGQDISNLSISSSPAFQAHGSPTNTNNNQQYNKMNANSPLIPGLQTPGSDHSASMTPSSYRRANSSNITSIQPQTTTNSINTNVTGNGTNTSTVDASSTTAAGGDIGSELFGAVYANSGLEPSAHAYPVINFCMNQTLTETDNDNNNNNIEDTNIENRKYPVNWLLNVGKEIREPPNHPKDDIPDPVKFINTIRNAGNRWKQHAQNMSQQRAANVSNSPLINTNSPIPTGSSRFAPVHQLPPHQLQSLNIGGTSAASSSAQRTTTDQKTTSSDDRDERSWRTKEPKQPELNLGDAVIANQNQPQQPQIQIQQDETKTMPQNEDPEIIDVEDKMVTPQPNDAIADTQQQQIKTEDAKPDDTIKDEDSNPLPQLAALDINISNEAGAATTDQPSNEATKAPVRAAMVAVPGDNNEDPAQTQGQDPKLPMNGAVSAEDFEQQLRQKQQQTPRDDQDVTTPASITTDDVPTPAGPTQAEQDAMNAMNAAMNAEADEAVDNFVQKHHTPELKPDPREYVEDDPNGPAWANDDGDMDANAFNQDFQFVAIDKQRDRAQQKKTGDLPTQAATISTDEYERRKQLEAAGGNNNPSQAMPVTEQSRGPRHPSRGPGHPSRPPMTHGYQGYGYDSYTSPALGGQGLNSYNPRKAATPLRSHSTPDGSLHTQRPVEDQTDLPIDKLPSRIRGIVVRLDEDIAKISTYIQQVKLEDDQLNRYQRHLHKLIARRGQYANWWKIQQAKLQGQQTLDPANAARNNQANDDNNGSRQGQGNNSVSVGLRHTNSLQQLEHYKDYYNKQLEKMIANASNDPKFNTYVDYYKQKLKAVEKRQRELEAKLNREGGSTATSPKQTEDTTQKEGGDNSQSKLKGSSIIDVISDQNKSPGPGIGAQSNITTQPQNDANGDGDAFANIMDLGSLGYTAAAPSSKPAHPYNPQTSGLTPQTQPRSGYDQSPQASQQETSDAMAAYMGYSNSRGAGHPNNPRKPGAPSGAAPVNHQKQKLKQYIRQHALKYVKPPPDPSDETYPQWYAGLRKVESIIYAKYMNKQRKRMQEALARQQQGGSGQPNPNMPPPNDQNSAQRRPDPNNPTNPQNPNQPQGPQGPPPNGPYPQQPHGHGPGPQQASHDRYPPSQRSPSNPGQYPPRNDPNARYPPHGQGYPAHGHGSPNMPPQPHNTQPTQGQYPPQSSGHGHRSPNMPPTGPGPNNPPQHGSPYHHPQGPPNPNMQPPPMQPQTSNPYQNNQGPPGPAPHSSHGSPRSHAQHPYPNSHHPQSGGPPPGPHPQSQHPSHSPRTQQSPQNYPSTHRPSHHTYPQGPPPGPGPRSHTHTVPQSPPHSGYPPQGHAPSHHGSQPSHSPRSGPSQQPPSSHHGSSHHMAHLNINHGHGNPSQHPRSPNHGPSGPPPSHQMHGSPAQGPYGPPPNQSSQGPQGQPPSSHHRQYPQQQGNPSQGQPSSHHHYGPSSHPASMNSPPMQYYNNQGQQQGGSQQGQPPQPHPSQQGGHNHNRSPPMPPQSRHHEYGQRQAPQPHPQQQGSYHHYNNTSPPNPPTTTSHGYTTYTTSPPNQPHPGHHQGYPPSHQQQGYPPQNRSPPNQHYGYGDNIDQ